MADKIINTRIRQKYDSEANWKSKNPILLDGELAFSRDKNNKYKVGDGVSKWSDLSYSIDDVLAAYLAKTGGTITGDVTFDSTLYSKNVTGSSKNGIILLPKVPYTTIDPTHTNEIYLKELCKWICTKYPNCDSRIFIGTGAPNTQGTIIIHIYDTNGVKDGYPQYASGIYVTLQNFYTFGFSEYKFYYKNITFNGHTHAISQISDISNASVKSATKLTTARNIKISGAVTSNNGVNFDGSANVSIPINSVKESYLTWGGKNFTGDFGCIDAAMIPDLGANRLAFGKPAGVIVEYSRDSGTAWTDYDATDANKSQLLSTGTSFYIGKANSSNPAKASYQLRVTLDSDALGVYSQLNKFAIYISTNGCQGCYCTIDASLESTPTTFVKFADKVPISGWSGWNIINTSNITTYNNSKSNQYGLIRFTFGCTADLSESNQKYIGLQLIRLMGFGGVGWNTPSNMAKYGTIYSYDYAQNVGFPAQVTATKFVGSLSGNATTATALGTSAGSATQPVYFKDGKPVVTTYTLGKSVPSDAKFTDTNTWRGIQNNLTSDAIDQSLSAAQGKALKTLVDGKASISHKHTISEITDISDASVKSATTASSVSTRGTATATTGRHIWFSASNETERAHNDSFKYTPSTNTVSSNISGNAATATKLATTRTVSGGIDIPLSFTYNGSANSSASVGFYSSSIKNQNQNNYSYHRFAKLDPTTEVNKDKTMTVYISQDYNGGGFGIARLSVRMSTTTSTAEVKWLVRSGLPSDSIQIAIYNVTGKTYADAFFKTTGAYQGTVIRAIASGARGGISRTWTLIDSSEVKDTTTSNALDSVESYVSISAAGTKLHKQAYSTTVSGIDSAEGFMTSANKTNLTSIVGYFDESQYVTDSDISKLFG